MVEPGCRWIIYRSASEKEIAVLLRVVLRACHQVRQREGLRRPPRVAAGAFASPRPFPRPETPLLRLFAFSAAAGGGSRASTLRWSGAAARPFPSCLSAFVSGVAALGNAANGQFWAVWATTPCCVSPGPSWSLACLPTMGNSPEIVGRNGRRWAEMGSPALPHWFAQHQRSEPVRGAHCEPHRSVRHPSPSASQSRTGGRP